LQSAELEKIADDHYQLRGDVTLYTASSLASVDAFSAVDKVTIDLSAVGKTDSGTLALLVNWQRRAARQGKVVVFSNLPASLESLMGLYDLGSVLELN
jgi:ABC-type transporter Mla MlaB component